MKSNHELNLVKVAQAGNISYKVRAFNPEDLTGSRPTP